MPRVQAIGADLEEISSKSSPMLMMLMMMLHVNGGQPLRVVFDLPSTVPECLARDIEKKKAKGTCSRKLFSDENEPSSRSLSLNRSQYGGCSTKYNSSAGT
jgi:hypothetical protein